MERSTATVWNASDTLCVPLQSTRSYLYVEDVAEAFDMILHKGVVGETYNIGTQKERTVMDVAKAICKYFDLPEDRIIHVRDRAFNDQRCTTALPMLHLPACSVLNTHGDLSVISHIEQQSGAQSPSSMAQACGLEAVCTNSKMPCHAIFHAQGILFSSSHVSCTMCMYR